LLTLVQRNAGIKNGIGINALLGFIVSTTVGEKSASKSRIDTAYSVKLSFPGCKTAAVSILWFDVRSEDTNKIKGLYSSEQLQCLFIGQK
jgi:hypothetical protein